MRTGRTVYIKEERGNSGVSLIWYVWLEIVNPCVRLSACMYMPTMHRYALYCGMQSELFKTSILFLPKTLNFNMKEIKIHYISKGKKSYLIF